MTSAGRRCLWIACAILVGIAVQAWANSAPEVTNVVAQQRPGTKLVDIYYHVYDADGDLMAVTATCSDGAGGMVPITSTQQGSDIGPGISSGQSKHIVWDAGVDMPGHAGDDYVVRVTACDSGDEPEMVLVPAGTFMQGDGVAYCGVDQRSVTLTRDFYLGQHEVANHEYMEAVQWAYDNGYVTATTSSVSDNLDGSTEELLNMESDGSEIQFDGAGTFYLQESHSSLAQIAYPEGYDPGDHPVKEVTWYGSVRYCDWLSLQADLPRAYAHSGDWLCNDGDPYGADGYRLPRDAEWEYAAQHNDDRAYPWGNESPSCSLANYGFCIWWTSPVGSHPAGNSALGLSDMAGSMWEWCNDSHICSLGTDPVTDPVERPTATHACFVAARGPPTSRSTSVARAGSTAIRITGTSTTGSVLLGPLSLDSLQRFPAPRRQKRRGKRPRPQPNSQTGSVPGGQATRLARGQPVRAGHTSLSELHSPSCSAARDRHDCAAVSHRGARGGLASALIQKGG